MRSLAFARKLIFSAATAIAISLLCFLIIYNSPGDPAELLLRAKNPAGALHQQAVEGFGTSLGTDQGFFPLYFNWLAGALVGDFGISYKTGIPVIDEFGSRIGVTLSLVLATLVFATVLGLVLGFLSAKYHNRAIDSVARFLSVFNLSAPSFWVALLLLWVFSAKLKLVPPFGYNGPESLILPTIAMGLSYSGSIQRVTRVNVLDSYAKEYVLTARAKGLSEGTILVRHVLKNVMTPVLTIVGTNFSNLLGGTIIIENIFGLPGIGNYLVTAIGVKDYPAILGFVFLFSVMVIVMNLVIDVLYRVVDPRVGQEAR